LVDVSVDDGRTEEERPVDGLPPRVAADGVGGRSVHAGAGSHVQRAAAVRVARLEQRWGEAHVELAEHEGPVAAVQDTAGPGPVRRPVHETAHRALRADGPRDQLLTEPILE